MRLRYISACVATIAIGLITGCANPSSSDPVMKDVSPAMATIVADLSMAQTVSTQVNFVDETSATAESGSTATIQNATSKALLPTVSAVITVTQSKTTGFPTLLQAGDIVTVVRTWTNAEGESVVDTVVRPKLPNASDFSGSSVITPTFAVSGVSASYSGTAWTLTGTETKTINGITFAQKAIVTVYSSWDSTDARPVLFSITKTGENINLFTTHVKLTTTIYYTPNSTGTKDIEYLRVLDYVGVAGAKLKRQVYAWGVTPTITTAPTLYDSTEATNTPGSTLTFTPNLAPDSGSGRTTVSFWYYSDPTVPVSAYTPAYTSNGSVMASYPKLDVSQWVGSVIQESGPRIADWYKPIVSATTGKFVGNYTRRNEHTYYSGGSTDKIYSLTDGTTLLQTVGTQVYQTAGNGTVTTTKTFSDGIKSTVTITPTDDSNGNITGYVITRGATTYTTVYTKDSSGNIVSISVTNSTTGVTKVFTESNGTWS